VDNKIKVLVATMPSIAGGLLTHLIQSQSDMELVKPEQNDMNSVEPGQSDRVLDEQMSKTVKLLVGANQADVVILPQPDSGEIPGICSHLLAEYPDLRVVVLSITGDTVYTAERVLKAPVENILKAIRTAVRTNHGLPQG
jgi:hypothetical protein